MDFENKNLKTALLYRLSVNGEEISKFHELCDNQGPTLTLFQTEDNNKGEYLLHCLGTPNQIKNVIL